MSDLIQASLAEIRARLAGGDVSAEAVAKACLDRIAETEPSIHALITVREQALEEARALDAQGPDASKPLWGVPVTVKDAIVTKGTRTTAGSKILGGFNPFYDAFVVERLKEAGAVIVGKNNIGSVARVPDANYDKQTSAAVYAKTPDYFTYQYDTGRKGLPSMAVYFEMQNMTTGVALDEATFPDAAFRALLAETADVNGDSRLSALELRHVSELNCSNLGIADLTGIEYFTELVALNCENNKLTALDVSKNTHLSEIYCGGNQLATLDLTGLPIKDAETDTGHVQTLPGSYALTGTENGVGLFDLSQIVGKDNIGSITAVKGASYDKEAGIARYSAAVEKPSYTYATGSSAVSLTVSFSLDMSTMPKSPFTDVVAGSWYFDAALYASSHNLMLGTSPTEFSPNITMTRGMLVTVLYRMNGSPSVSGKTPFTDVRTDEWYSAAVLWAYQNSIVTGMSDTTFAPINNVTREQMATILFRYTKTAAPDKAKASADLSGFADAGNVNDWAVDAMRWAVGQKLIAGITLEQSVYLQPRGNATRAQAATVLTRYYAQ